MTQYAQGSRSQVTYIKETNFGVTPSPSPTLIAIPYTNFNINATIDQFKDTSVRPDRQERTSNSGNTHVAGDFDVQLNHHNFDPFFESLLTGSFATNVLKIGTTQSSFTFEQGSLDIGQYFSYTGVVIDKLALTVNTTGNVTAKFSVMGKSVALSATTLCATPTAITDATPYSHAGGTFKEGGTVTALVSALTLNIDNGMSANFTLGATTAQSLSESMIKITGSATVMFSDAVIANKFLSGTATSLDFTLTDGTNTMEIALPNVKYTGMSRQVTGQGTITLTVPFTALYDHTSATAITVTRSS
jgi:hypothetical protein